MGNDSKRHVGDWLDGVATGFGRWMSNPYTFLTVFAIVVTWTIAGFFLGFAENWLSGMHMIGPVVTLLLVFLLQHGQAKNTRAIQLKLDELLGTQTGARKGAIKSERRPVREMERMEENATEVGSAANNLQEGGSGAHARSKGHAGKQRRRKAHRDLGDGRRRAGARPGTRAPRARSKAR